MANKTTVALTREQFELIITTMKEGFGDHRPNERVAEALTLEANLGLRVSDILQLKLSDIVKDGGRFRLDVIEQKTGKKRTFTVPAAIYDHIKIYCLDHGIGFDEIIFPLTERAIQKHLKACCDFLELENISTHSFRKFFATEIYKNNGYNLELVRILLQHTSSVTTQRYLGISSQEVENALSNHICLV